MPVDNQAIIRFLISTSPSNVFALRQYLIASAQQAGQFPFISKLTIPAAFTSTTLGIEGSDDNSTWVTLGDFRGAYTQASVVANTVILLPEHVTKDWRFIRLTSSASQAAQRDIVAEISFTSTPPAR
jgi:hypothetical protein